MLLKLVDLRRFQNSLFRWLKTKRITEEETKFIKSMEDKVLFVETLLNPPAPNSALKSAVENYNNLFTSDDPSDFKPFCAISSHILMNPS